MDYAFGKKRGLQTLSTAGSLFTILPLDHLEPFRKILRPQAPDTVTHAEVVSAKLELMRALAPHASAVLLDAIYSLAPAIATGVLPGQVGLMAAVEDGDDAAPGKPGRRLADWSVAQIKRLGAAAVKFYFFYSPNDAPTAAAQEKLIRELVSDCRHHDLPFFAEPVVYGGDRRRLVIEAARHIGRLGVDVLKMEFPVDMRREPDESVCMSACEELSHACPVPWALLSAGVDFETFTRQLTVACQAGASGYIAGRAIWQEALSRAGADRDTFIRQTVIPRMETLNDIVNRHGRPWTDFYPDSVAPIPEDWRAHYAA